ncbi:unnamed protein product [Adineta ricciae]|uniref:Uncharacterized protein n=1 Tax=Adineta ricciae TaxID=249248 RepID=A0A816DNU8_ADIRI|nr:unnamed protein product [Adineta ricciae]
MFTISVGENDSQGFIKEILIRASKKLIFNEWKQHAITVAAGNGKRMKIKKRIVARGNGQGSGMDRLDTPTDVIVDQQNNSLIIADWGTNEWKIEEKGEGKVVAGGNGKGNQLNESNFIFVDDEHSIYVADFQNARVMKWKNDANEGIVVADGNGDGHNLNQLNDPQGIIVDGLGRTYVADCRNHRIMRWSEGDEEGEIIVGGNGHENGSNQLQFPRGLSFDDGGNLYVADSGNNRIQRFDLIRS